jgi:hypothetical protein
MTGDFILNSVNQKRYDTIENLLDQHNYQSIPFESCHDPNCSICNQIVALGQKIWNSGEKGAFLTIDYYNKLCSIGLLDDQIAAECYMSLRALNKWKVNNGLPVLMKKPRVKRSIYRKEENEQGRKEYIDIQKQKYEIKLQKIRAILRLVDQGYNTDMIANYMGMDKKKVNQMKSSKLYRKIRDEGLQTEQS